MFGVCMLAQIVCFFKLSTYHCGVPRFTQLLCGKSTEIHHSSYYERLKYLAFDIVRKQYDATDIFFALDDIFYLSLFTLPIFAYYYTFRTGYLQFHSFYSNL